MKKILFVVAILVAGMSLFIAMINSAARQAVTPLSFSVPQGWPQPEYNFRENPLTQEGFELGRRLFYDGQLSADGNVPCASCHQQEAAFANIDHNLSHGVNHQFSTRNASTLANLAWHKEFMFDGKISHLDLQPLEPLTNPNEMGETVENVLKKLRKDKLYPKMFKAAFGDTLINMKRMTKALSQFMLMMVSANSKYDKVKRGEASFNLPESLGYEIFKKKCASCHTEPLFTDLSYRNAGLSKDEYLNDPGRMAITHNSRDSLKFKVPTLRNIMLTAPYGHDGRFYTLINVFEHYKKEVINGPTTDSLLRQGIVLSNYEIGQLTAFLYALTDSSLITDKRFSIPEGMAPSEVPDPEHHQHHAMR